MLYLIGLGLNEKSYSWEAYGVISKAKVVYIENYTVEFPYELKRLKEQFKGKRFVSADRELVESLKILKEAKNKDVALLVYGSPLMATTHITLLEEAKKLGVNVKVIHNASVFDAVAETGLQPYKFGKITSIPGFEADSYISLIKENLILKAHTLVLVDIGMSSKEALERLRKDSQGKSIKIEKVVLCSRLGNDDSKMFYGKIEEVVGKKAKAPFCIVIPGKLHFTEEEVLESLN